MRRIINFSLYCVMILLVAGCAGTLPTNSYVPQNIVRTSGSIDMGTFIYTPYVTGAVKKPNQIQNRAMGSLYISTDVADFVKRGTALELEKSGVALNPDAPIKLDGDILEFQADDLGYSIDWTYKIAYKIIQKSDSKILFEQTFAPAPKKSGKFGLAQDYSSIVGENVLTGYDLFIRNPEVRQILENSALPQGSLDKGKVVKK